MSSTKTVFIIIGAIIIIPILYFIYLIHSLAPGTHGSQASYSFSKSKYELETEIDSIITFDPQVIRKELDPPPEDNYYNKDGYFTIFIKEEEYCFRYYGNSTHWDENTTNSEIFIVAIRSGGIKNSKEKSLKIVEENFVNKLKGQITEWKSFFLKKPAPHSMT